MYARKNQHDQTTAHERVNNEQDKTQDRVTCSMEMLRTRDNRNADHATAAMEEAAIIEATCQPSWDCTTHKHNDQGKQTKKERTSEENS